MFSEISRDGHAGRGDRCANGHERHQDVDQDRNPDRGKDGNRYIPLGIDHLFAGLGNDLVALEGNKRQAHCRQDTNCAVCEEIGRYFRLAEILAGDRQQSKDDQCAQDRNLRHREDVSRRGGLRCAAVVDEDEGQNDDGHEAHRKLIGR